MRILLNTFIIFFFSCSSPKKEKIIVPKLQTSFYATTMEQINNQLKAEPNNAKLVDKKLFYCDKLNWPRTCIKALDSYKKSNGMTNQLAKKYILFYENNQQNEPLFHFIEKWNNELNLKKTHIKTYIDCLIQLNKNEVAKKALENFIQLNQSIKNIYYVSSQHLRMNDTTMAVQYLDKLYELDPKNDLMWEYGNILFKLGYHKRGNEVLSNHIKEHRDDLDIQLRYAQLLRNTGLFNQAREILSPYSSIDSIAYLLVDWYKKDLMWDSSVFILKNRIVHDPTNKKPIRMLATLYEEHYWRASALKYYKKLKKIDPSDLLVQQKIAYLQRLIFERNKIPTIELKSIKIKNINE